MLLTNYFFTLQVMRATHCGGWSACRERRGSGEVRKNRHRGRTIQAAVVVAERQGWADIIYVN